MSTLRPQAASLEAVASLEHASYVHMFQNFFDMVTAQRLKTIVEDGKLTKVMNLVRYGGLEMF